MEVKIKRDIVQKRKVSKIVLYTKQAGNNCKLTALSDDKGKNTRAPLLYPSAPSHGRAVHTRLLATTQRAECYF